MECGGDFVCDIISLLLEHGFIASDVASILNEAWSGPAEKISPAAAFLQKYFANIVSIAIGSYGIWRGWRYREAILHKRFVEYLAEQDKRLDSARGDLLTAIERPSPSRNFVDPVFADVRLRSVLRERRWDFATFGRVVVRSANQDLDDSLRFIANRIETTEGMLRSFREQRATAHLIRGAVAAAEAPNAMTKEEGARRDHDALVQFRTALQVPGHEQDLEAKEYEAHQLRKLGDLDAAEEAYGKLEDWARNIKDVAKRDMLLARSKTCRAMILQTRSLIAFFKNGHGANGGSASANNLLCEVELLRQKHSPYSDWDLLDQADLHYFRALVYNRLQFPIQQQSQLAATQTSIDRLLQQCPKIRFAPNAARKRLRKRALEAQMRLQRAIKCDHFDLSWLLPAELDPASHNPQQPAHSVRSTGGDEGIQKTA